MKFEFVGGYSEVGKNMTLVEVNSEEVILDMGLYLPPVVAYEEGDPRDLTREDLIRMGAIPDDNKVDKRNVKGIIFGHAHLDHIGAAPYLAKKYGCDLFGTKYTMCVLKTLFDDKNKRLKNNIVSFDFNHRYRLCENFSFEFFSMTHSTVQTALVVLYTRDGNIAYSNDYKIDNNPVLSDRINTEKLKGSKDAIFFTTFASHIPRLRSIVDYGRKLGRKIVFLGRSMEKYVNVARELKIVDFTDVEIVGYGNLIKKRLKDMNENRGNYLVVCTGNQGEKGSVLTRIVDRDLPFSFNPGDNVIFSCRTIPTKETIENREYVEKRLQKNGIRIWKDVHVSGHGCQEDAKILINLLKPEHIILSHGDPDKVRGNKKVAKEIGYRDSNIHIVRDGEILVI